MNEFFADHWLTIVWVVAGMIVCTAGGLLSLTPDPEKPAQFLPVYFLALLIFVTGLLMIVRCTTFLNDVYGFGEYFGIG
ncbi:MAG: hypothetical protein ACE5KM_13325 [Planctomycetaceae bacterium]